MIGCLEDGKPARYLLKRAPSPSKTVAIAGEESFSTVSLAALEDAERLSVLIGRGALLLAKKGWGADQVGGVYKEAVELADKMIRARRPGVDRSRAEAGIGLWSNSLVRGNLRVAKNEGKKLLEFADRNDDHSTRVVAYRVLGTNAFWLGQFVEAERFLRRCLLDLGDGYCLAEIYRVRGEIRWLSKRRFAAAEKDLRKALQIASDQKAQTFRLRAAMSLLRFARARTDLEGDRVRHDAAREQRLLRSILRKFQYEPDSADLRKARSLLAGSNGPAVPDPADVS